MRHERLEAAMRTPGATTARFDRWAAGYDDSHLQPALYVPVHRTALGLAQRLVPRPGRVLDVGCGTARLLRQARRQFPHAELVGVDLAWGVLAAAKVTAPTEPAVRLVDAAAERLPFSGEAFDLAFATLSLRHWTDPDAGTAQLARVLRPGGVLVVADTFPAAGRRARAVPLRRRQQAVPGELATVLAVHGLTVVAHDRVPWFALPDVQIVATRKRPLPGVGKPRSGDRSVAGNGVRARRRQVPLVAGSFPAKGGE
jgi:ubiquinone/menaquinone biosynthesis C-methylase UbiE